MNYSIKFLLIISLFFLNANINAYALARRVEGKSIIEVSGNYGGGDGRATFSYDPSKIKGVGVETVRGKLISFNLPNLEDASGDGDTIIVFKNGQFQDILFWFRYGFFSKVDFSEWLKGGMYPTFANGGLIWDEVNVY